MSKGKPSTNEDTRGTVVPFEKIRSSQDTGGVNADSWHGDPDGTVPDPKRPCILVDGNLAVMTTKAWIALGRANVPPQWFRYGELIARIQRDSHARALVRELTKDRLRFHLARASLWRDKKLNEIPPPNDILADMLAHPEPSLPILTRLVEAPIFAPDGTVCTEPGYHASGQVFFAPAKNFTVPSISPTPTSSEIRLARSLLLEDLLVDFPFIGAAERANAVALALLPFVRDLIEGPTPLHLFEKPTPGTGATLLVSALLFPALGYAVPTMADGKQEDEWRKRLTTKLRGSPRVLLIDNLRHPLESSALANAITTTTWEDRVIGTSKLVHVPVRCAWVATGNNPVVSNEIARRTIRIRLDAKVDQPWRRGGFKHPELLQWARERRADLVKALLTLGQAWIVAGRPQPPQKALGMFEEWTRVVGGILAHAGIDGFLGNLDSFYLDVDTESAALRNFLALWFGKFKTRPVGVADLYPLVRDNDLFDLGEGTEQSQRTRLGKMIGKQRDRHFGNYRIVAARAVGGSGRWRLDQASAISAPRVRGKIRKGG